MQSYLPDIPFSYVQNKVIWEFSKYNTSQSSKLICESLVELVKVVEKQIRGAMNGSQDTTLYDRWTYNGTQLCKYFLIMWTKDKY